MSLCVRANGFVKWEMYHRFMQILAVGDYLGRAGCPGLAAFCETRDLVKPLRLRAKFNLVL